MRVLLFAIGVVGLSVAAHAHEGALDSYGCHPNIAHGSYHCHRGPLAERQYDSRGDMVRAFHERERRKRPKPKRPPRGF